MLSTVIISKQFSVKEIASDKSEELLVGCIYPSPDANEIGSEKRRTSMWSCSYSRFLSVGDFNYPKNLGTQRMSVDVMYSATFICGMFKMFIYINM